jgi:hypothetical protein
VLGCLAVEGCHTDFPASAEQVDFLAGDQGCGCLSGHWVMEAPARARMADAASAFANALQVLLLRQSDVESPAFDREVQLQHPASGGYQ